MTYYIKADVVITKNSQSNGNFQKQGNSNSGMSNSNNGYSNNGYSNNNANNGYSEYSNNGYNNGNNNRNNNNANNNRNNFRENNGNAMPEGGRNYSNQNNGENNFRNQNNNMNYNDNSGNFETRENYNNASQDEIRIHDTNDFNFSKKTKIIIIIVGLIICIAIVAMCFLSQKCRDFMPTCLKLTEACQNFACAAESCKRALK